MSNGLNIFCAVCYAIMGGSAVWQCIHAGVFWAYPVNAFLGGVLVSGYVRRLF